MTSQYQLPDIEVRGAVSVGPFGTAVDWSGDMVQRARRAMADGHALILPDAVAPPLLSRIVQICRNARYVPEHIGQIGWRMIEEQDRAGNLLRFVLARPAMLRWIEAVSQCDALQSLTGVVAEMVPGTDQRLDWHDDTNAGPERRLAMVLQLSDGPCEGGVFELRMKETGRMLVQQANLPCGSLILFRVDPALSHRVTPVTDGAARRVFAGWLNG